RQNRIAVTQISLQSQAHAIGNQDVVALLQVFRAAAVEVAVFLDEFEGIGAPVRSERLDDIKMPDEEYVLAFSGSAKTRHEVVFAFARPGYLDIPRLEAPVAQTLGHRFGGGGHVANGVGGVDLNELLENVVRQLLDLLLTFGVSTRCPARDQAK